MAVFNFYVKIFDTEQAVDGTRNCTLDYPGEYTDHYSTGALMAVSNFLKPFLSCKAAPSLRIVGSKGCPPTRSSVLQRGGGGGFLDGYAQESPPQRMGGGTVGLPAHVCGVPEIPRETPAVEPRRGREAAEGGAVWPPRLIRWSVAIVLIIAVIAPSSDSATNVRRRLRKPSKVTSVTTSVSKSTDQVLSASVNRPKIRGRPSIASRKSSAALDNSVGTDEHKNKDGYKVVCYYTNWSQYRTKIGKFMPEDIQPDLCTHIIFAFGWLKKGKLSSFESNDETKDGKTGLYDRINSLKKANPKLKTLLAIGGWSFGTQKFKEMSASRYARQTFIYSAIPYLRDRSFDGLDVDWEYPKGGDDKKNYVLLLKELREAFEAEAQEVKKPRLLLTAAVPVGPDNIKSGYDVPAVAGYLDFINLMAYDFHGKWERETGHNAPLYAPSSDSEWRKQLSVDHAAHLWVKLGAPKDKLIIGCPWTKDLFASPRHSLAFLSLVRDGHDMY
ncbi:hypothetical protein evm_009421 [Chilo suppressalis]|nr:hypothetical protein evm_009421 [Chilo suppressalis]